MHFTPVGKPEDLQVVQRYLQENYWLDDLTARKVEAIWQYWLDGTTTPVSVLWNKKRSVSVFVDM